MAVNRKEIANQAGVAESTVGMILCGRGQRYSKKTREKVLEVAKQLNYRPDIAARGLKMKRSFLIGVLINTSNRNIAMDFLSGVHDALAEGDTSPVVFSHRSADDTMKSIKRCLDRRVDGLIVNVSAEAPDDVRQSQLLLRDDLPVVEVFGRYLPGVPSVNIDNVAAGRDATQHLIDLGHRRIALLTHDHYDDAKDTDVGLHFDAFERYIGYEHAIQSADLKPIVVTHPLVPDVKVNDMFFAGGETSFDILTQHQEDPTGVVCYDDYQAYGLIRAARAHDSALPRELSIISYGDQDLSRVISPRLTTLQVPAWQVGYRSTRMLQARIDGEEVEDLLLPSDVRIRDSTTQPADIS